MPIITNTPTPASSSPSPSTVANNFNNISIDVANLHSHTGEFIYSSSKVFGIRVRFKKQQHHQQQLATANDLSKNSISEWTFNMTGEYRFLKKENFKNDGRLIPGSYCDYYFFADATGAQPNFEIWKYFHSPRFPANYPAHIKCAYKFIGRPESRVEIIFEELHIHKTNQSCTLDKLTIFDSEAPNMNKVIDVVCDVLPIRRIISTGPDLLIEFNASSNITSKGFRGKFKFLHNEIEPIETQTSTTETPILMEKLVAKTQKIAFNANSLETFLKSYENCKQIFDSRLNKSGRFETAPLLTAVPGLFPMVGSPGAAGFPNVNKIPIGSYTTNFPVRIQCRYEFVGLPDERVVIKFLDFNMPTESKNSTECKLNDSLQLLTQMREKYEVTELLCGAFLPKPIMSRDSNLILQFVGKYPPYGSKINYYGFKAEYKFLTNFGITTGRQVENNCTFIYNSTERKSGWFSSPNFPGYYPQDMICNYLFYGENEEKIIIHFTYFDVEGIGICEYSTASDYVEFSNFMSTDRKYRKYCGKRDKFQIRSDGRFFRVTFYSNDRFDRTGFRALYDFENKYIRVENTSMQSYTSGNAGNAVVINIIFHFSSIFFIFMLIFIQ